MAPKTRKQLKNEASAIAAEAGTIATELSQLKTPEGIADYLFSMRDDDDFSDRLHGRMSVLREAHHAELIAQAEGEEVQSSETQQTEPPPSNKTEQQYAQE